MGATFSRIKTWVDGEDLEYNDLNAEFDNILTNMTPSGVDDYSLNATQMRVQTTPGTYGSESLATSLAGEIARLRYMLNEIIAGDNSVWYDTPAITLNAINQVLGEGTIPKNRIASGYARTDSNFPDILTPGSSSLQVTVRANASNPLVYYVDGVKYSITADVTLSSLSAAPSSNNTASVAIADFVASGSPESQLVGEYGEHFWVSSPGSEITGRDEQVHAFKYVNTDPATEYFIGRIVIGGTDKYLTDCTRGYFFDSSRDPIVPIDIENGTTITLLKMGWLFINTSGAILVTYNPPFIQDTEPTGPATGDFWFDVPNETWKTYSGSSWDAANATLLGVIANDETGTIGARPFEYWQSYTAQNGYIPSKKSNSVLRSTKSNFSVSVSGRLLNYPNGYLEHDMATDLASGLTEASNTDYYVYLTRDGKSVIDTVVPIDRRHDFLGFYHRYYDWRCIGTFRNEGSSDIDEDTVRLFERRLSDATNQDTRNGQVEGFYQNTGTATLTTSSTSLVTLLDDIPFVSTGQPIVVLVQGVVRLTEGGGTGRAQGTISLQRYDSFAYTSGPATVALENFEANTSSTDFYSTLILSTPFNALAPGFHALRLQVKVDDGSDSLVFVGSKVTVMEATAFMPPGSN